MISVITPVYNGEKFIAACIQNVIDQDCSDVEHIIVDGGSSDRTPEVIQSYAKRYQHIQWLSGKDRGQSDAMNKGIAVARGNILGFLNADDRYEPNVLGQVIELFQDLPSPSFLVGNCNVWNIDGSLRQINKPSKITLYDLVWGPYVNPYPYNPSAYFYHASLHKLAGLYKVEEHYAMDLDFILRAIQFANVKYVDEIWGNFCMNEEAKTVSIQKRGEIDTRVQMILRSYYKNLTISQQIHLHTVLSYKRINSLVRRTKRVLVKGISDRIQLEIH